MELLLVRHALPTRIEDADGPADPPLSEAGVAQAEHLASYLATEPISAIYVSPMRRAVETAAPLAARLGLEPVIEDGVAEYDRRSPSYIPVEQLKAENHPEWQAILDGTWNAELGVDPLAFHHLVVQTMEGIIARHRGEAVVVVCHGGVINS